MGEEYRKYNINHIGGRFNLKKLRICIFDKISSVDKILKSNDLRSQLLSDPFLNSMKIRNAIKRLEEESDVSIEIDS